MRSKGTVFQAEGTVRAKGLRQALVCSIGRTVRRPVCLEREAAGGIKGVRNREGRHRGACAGPCGKREESALQSMAIGSHGILPPMLTRTHLIPRSLFVSLPTFTLQVYSAMGTSSKRPLLFTPDKEAPCWYIHHCSLICVQIIS